MQIHVDAILPHFGEEPAISGTGGSGTVFFSGCLLSCAYCQNHQISSNRYRGKAFSPEELADEYLSLQDRGCHNINLVSPSHIGRGLEKSIIIARKRGLKIPVVYNCGGLEGIEKLRRLNGLIDIYLPDLKYSSDVVAQDLSGCTNYRSRSRAALKEMFRQVGNLSEDEFEGIAGKGLIVRHLVLPGDLSGTDDCLSFLACEISNDVCLSLMSQYNPRHVHAHPCGSDVLAKYPALGRTIDENEYDSAVASSKKYNMTRIWLQSREESPDCYSPDFDSKKIFDMT